MLRSFLPPARNERATPSRTHVLPAIASVIQEVQRIGIASIASSRGGTVSETARRAILEGRDILVIGCSPFDVHAIDDGYKADATVVFEGDPTRYRLRVTCDHSFRPVMTSDASEKA